MNEKDVAKKIVTNSHRKGYSLALVWLQDFINPDNVVNIVEWLRELSKKNDGINRYETRPSDKFLNFLRNK